MIYRITLFLFVTLLISGCCKKTDCDSDNFGVKFRVKGFSEFAYKSAFVKTFKKETGFSEPIDSFSLQGFDTYTQNNFNSYESFKASDTVNLLLRLQETDSSYFSYSVTNMLFQTVDCGVCGRTTPVKNLRSYVLNGIQIDYTTFGIIEIEK